MYIHAQPNAITVGTIKNVVQRSEQCIIISFVWGGGAFFCWFLQFGTLFQSLKTTQALLHMYMYMYLYMYYHQIVRLYTHVRFSRH